MKKLYILAFTALLSFYINDSMAQKTEVTMYTSMGNIVIEMEDILAPITVDSFVARVNRGFYDGLIFHRVIDNFMIQGGDPLGNGTGGTGTTIPDEFHSTLKNVPGALSMANRGTANTGDCQFFINLVTNAHLDNKHTVFGTVTTGFAIVQNIGKVPTNSNDKPMTDVTMDSVRVTRDPASTPSIVRHIPVIRVYPNPSQGMVTLDLPMEETNIMISDIHGKVVYEARTQNTNVLQADLSHLSKGVYIINVATADNVSRSKLLMQ